MNYRLTTSLLALALLLVVGVGATQAAPPASVNLAAPAGNYDFATHGTAWVPEARGQFQAFSPKGWGIPTRVKAPGSYWVHIPVSYPTYIAGSAMYIKYVEFCAKSTNGASSKPVHWDLWEADHSNFYSQDISWTANNLYHCWGHTFSPGTWRQDLGISVLLTFVNTTDTITLSKAWVSVNPAP